MQVRAPRTKDGATSHQGNPRIEFQNSALKVRLAPGIFQCNSLKTGGLHQRRYGPEAKQHKVQSG